MAELSLKQLDERLIAVEEALQALWTAFENATIAVVDAPEWLDDVLVGVINALFQIRQQGAYNLAKELEAKYFPDSGVESVGDRLTTSSDLKRSGG